MTTDSKNDGDLEKVNVSVNPAVEVLDGEDQSRLSLWQYIKANRRSFGWSIYLLMNMVNYGFDGLLTGSLVGIPSFQQNFGYYDETSGQYIISALWQSLWTAITSIMIMVGALLAGQLNGRVGLRLSLVVAMVFTVGGIIFEQLCNGPAEFLGAKVIAGVGYGLQTALCIMSLPAYAPVRLRGPLGACLNTFILFGGWLAQGTLTGTGSAYLNSTKAYQIPFGLQYIFVGIIVTGLPFLPESADFHLRRNDVDSARRALIRLHGPSRMLVVESELHLATVSRQLDLAQSNGRTSVSAWEPLRKANIKRTMISAGLLGFQQLVGATFVTSYLTYFFQVAGTPVRLSLALGEMSFSVQVVGNLVSWYAIDKLGRRACLVGGLGSMTVILLIIGITWAVRTAASLWVMVAFMTLWAFLYQGSIGACGYSVAAETPSPRLRSSTIAIAQAFGQVCAWAMGFATPYMINPDEANLGGYVGFVFAGLCGLATVWTFFSIPETASRTMAEIDEMWADEVPVRNWKGHVCRVTAEASNYESS